jgi:hypothetical protein
MTENRADQFIRTTEWEDIQYKHGNKVGRYATHELEIMAQNIARRHEDTTLEAYDPNRERVADKLDRGGYEDEARVRHQLATRDGNASDSDDSGPGLDDDDDALTRFRERRLQAMREQQERNVFGALRSISGASYIAEITEASAQHWVVAAMVEPGHPGCEALISVFSELSRKHRDTKFVACLVREAIPNFPPKHLPCVVIYHSGAMQHQTTGMEPWVPVAQLGKPGAMPTAGSVERKLRQFEVLPPNEDDSDGDEGEDDVRTRRKNLILGSR